MYIFGFVVILIILFSVIILRLPVFGSLPSKESEEKIATLPFYKNGAFENLSPTPMYQKGVTTFTILKEFLKKNPDRRPDKVLPSIKPDLSLKNKLSMTWFGHSSYLVQADDLNILVDPIFNSVPSPFSFLGSKSYAGTDIIKAEDFRELDIVLLTHDHYDHLDYPTILKLKNKTKQFVVSIGVAAHLIKWGVNKSIITEMGWGDTANPLPDVKFICTSARHFSGRKFKHNQSLWSGFVLQTKNNKIYLGGDSGYEKHFKEIGEQHGPFDIAILECGQYNANWPNIHMAPEQTVQAAIDLQAKVLMPVHWGKFTLALHNWDEPIKRVVKKAAEENVKITTPMLGETVIIDEYYPDKPWWLINQ
jgi:L-ascorbate metabolism protein UlaG (beta-lactamase superfamily)